MTSCCFAFIVLGDGIPSTGSLGRRFGEPRLTPENGDPTSRRDRGAAVLGTTLHIH